MDNVSDLLQAAVGTTPSSIPDPAPVTLPVPQQKQAEVQAATDAKKVELGGYPDPKTLYDAYIMRRTGAGLSEGTPLQQDIATLSADQFRQKYGPDLSSHVIRGMGTAATTYNAQTGYERSLGQHVGDALLGAGSAAIGGLGGLAAYGVGHLNAKAGVALTQGLGKVTDAIQGNSSTPAQVQRDAARELSNLKSQDTSAQYDLDKQSFGPVIAGLGRVTSDAGNTVKDTLNNPTLLEDAAAQGVGTLAAMGPVSKALGLAAKTILPAAARQAVIFNGLADGATGAAARAATVAGKFAPDSTMVAGGLMGGSGAYTGAVNETYNRLIAQGVSPEDATAQANHAGLVAGAIATPLATVASKISSKFMSHPTETSSLRETLANTGKQSIEQAAQGVIQQGAQNYGAGNDLTEGMGDAVAQGVIGGVTSAGALQAPGLLTAAVRGAGKSAVDAVMARGQAKQTANAAASGTSPENVAKAASDFTQASQSPQAKAAFDDATSLAQAHDQVQAQDSDAPAHDSAGAMEALGQKIQDYGKFDHTEITQNPALSASVRAAVAQAPDRATAAMALAHEVEAKGAHTPEGLAAATELNKQLTGYEKIVTSDLPSMEAIPDNHPSIGLINGFNDVVDKVNNTPSVLKAKLQVQGLSEEQIAKLIHPVTEEGLHTQQGQQNVQNALLLAQQAPEKLPLETVHQISQMAENGKLKLTPEQLAALKTASAIVQSARQASDDRAKLGLTKSDTVSDQVLTNPNKDAKGKNSAAYYATGVYQGMKAGNLDHARAHMEDLGHLVQHMQNKLTAINTHYTNGDGTASLPFEAWNSEQKKPYITPKEARVGVTTKGDKAENSVIHAQRVALDTSHLTDVYNHLSKAFPELKAGSFDHTELHPNLNNKADKIVSAHARGDLVRPAFDRASVVREAKPADTFKPHDNLESTPKGSSDKSQAESAKETTSNAKHSELVGRDEPRAALDRSGDSSGSRDLSHSSSQEGDSKPEPVEPDHEARQKLIEDYGFDPFTIRPGEAERVLHFMETATKLSPQELKSKFDEANKAWKKNRGDKELTYTRDLLEAAILHEDYLATKAKAEATPDETSSPQAEEVSAKGAKAEEEIKTENTSKVEAPKVDQPTATPSAVDHGASPKTEGEKVAPRTTKEAFPNLVHAEDSSKGKNWFHEAYKLVKDKSRIVGDAKLSDLMKALKSHSALEDYIGGERSHELTPEVSRAYRSYLVDALPALRKTLDQSLKDRLAKTIGSGANEGKSHGDLLAEGYANQQNEGKHLNLVEKQADGSYKFNDALANHALLAGLQWVLNYNERARKPDDEYVNTMTGIPKDLAGPHIKDFTGVSDDDAIRAISRRILDYWGVKKSDDAFKSFTDGIAASMAAEVLDSLENTKINGKPLIQVKKLSFTEHDGVPLTKEQAVAPYKTRPSDGSVIPKAKVNVNQIQRTLPFYEKGTRVVDPLFRDTSILDEAILKDAPKKNYYGEDKIPAAKTQLHTTTPLTTPQRAMVQRAQSVEHFANMHIYGLYEALSTNNLLDMFGGGSDVDSRSREGTINQMDADSLKGQNQTIMSAIQSLDARIAEMKNMGKEDLHTIPIRYQFGVATNGRLMMQGDQNPQLSKLAREVFLPTWSNLDLTNQEHMDMFKTAIAQAVGLKIHTMETPEIIRQVDALLGDKLAKTVGMLKDHLTGSELDSNFTTEIKNALGEKLTPNAMHALQEYARYKSLNDVSKFHTGLYLEADGVTNGVVNALHMFTSGRFTPDQILNMRKGGFLYGDSKSMNEMRSKTDDIDLYKSAANALQGTLQKDFQSMHEDDPLRKQMNNLFTVMSTMMGPDLTFNGSDKVEINRGVTKNPMTITFYGSGRRGIAGNLAGEIVSRMYAGLSKVAADPTRDLKVMFGGDQAKADSFWNAFHELLNSTPIGPKEGMFMEPTKLDPLSGTASDLKLTQAHFDALKENVLRLLVSPMIGAVSKTLGESMMASKDLLQKVTQVQSTVAQHVFNAKVEELKKANGGFFPSENQLKGIMKEIHEFSPLVDTGSQSFFPVKTGRTETNDQVGSSFGGRFRTNADYFGPTEVGVGGLAMLNQGMGDGRMIQEGINSGISRYLPVFDGINFDLASAKAHSETMNKAVATTWGGNPLRALHDSYSTFMDAIRGGLLDKYPKVFDDVVKAMIPEDQRASVTKDDLEAYMARNEKDLGIAADGIDARHDVIAKFQYGVDHMAGAQATYTHKGLPLPGTANEISRLFNTHLGEKEAPESEVKTSDQSKNASQDIENRIEDLAVTPANRDLWNRILNSNVLDNYRSIVGSLSEIEAYRANLGLAMPEQVSETTKGFIDYKSKIIHLVSPTGETMLHEAIHAATFAQVLAHYEGEKLEPHVHDAVNRLEVLKDDFLKLDSMNRPDSFYDASKAIRDAQELGTPEGKAQALNEFMAWTLANKDLTEVTKGEKASPLAQLAKGVWEAIKTLLFGKYAPKVGDDIYSNLLFNTSILVQEQPRVADVSREMSSFQNPSYGQDDRIAGIQGKFDMALGRYIKPNDPEAQVEARKSSISTVRQAAKLFTSAETRGFEFTPQSRNAFERVAQVMSLNMKLNPSSLSRMEELYRHVTDHLTPEMLENPNEADRTWAKHVAEEKYNLLMGAEGMRYDAQERSSLLPVFMGLSLVDDGLRRALREIPLPEGAKLADGSLDTRLSHMAETLMDQLASKLSKQGKVGNVGEAIDALTNSVANSAIEDTAIKDLIVGAPTSAVNMVNGVVVKAIEGLSDIQIARNKKIQNDPNASKFSKEVNKFGEGIAKFVNDKYTDEVGETMLTGLNKIEGWQYFKDMAGDLVGRTNINGDAFDLIKKAHKMVDKVRQEFRDNLPKTLEKQFSRKLQDGEKSVIYHAVAKTDLASLISHDTPEKVLQKAIDPKLRQADIKTLESFLRSQDEKHFEQVRAKADQLANHMVTGEHGPNPLQNAEAVSDLLGEKKAANRQIPSQEYRDSVDRLITLYALDKLDPGTKKVLAELVQSEGEGMNHLLSYLNGLRKTEVSKADGMAKYNAVKGYVPSGHFNGTVNRPELIVAHDRDAKSLLERSFVKVGDYKGSRLDGESNGLGYWQSPVSLKSKFQQGLIQNVVHTAGGVDRATGFTDRGITAGRITDPGEVASIAKHLGKDGATTENLKAIYNENGRIVAFERMIDPQRLRAFNNDTDLTRMTGVWAGRQVEEEMSGQFNRDVIDRLHEMYNKDSNKGSYVNLYDKKVQDSDPVLKDIVRLMNRETRAYIGSKFGDKFMVRADMIRDLGYRSASIGDAWSGITRWKPETQQAVQRLALGFLGNDAYKTLVGAEQNWQSIMKDAKSFIIVRSMIVPAKNFISNMYQLTLRGVTPLDILRGMPKKLSEAHLYAKGRVEEMEYQVKLKTAEGAHDLRAQVQLKAKIQSIHDGWKRLSIWPLIEAGEFGAVSNAHVTHDDLLLTGGRIDQFIAKQVDKLPKAAQTAARYALVTPDTALYKGLSKAIEYGDFLGKAIYYDHLMQRKGLDADTARAKVSEEFVNFDRLPGRDRGYLDSIGANWFFNHKLRSAKIALSIIRENPVQALLSAQLGHYQPDTPLQANILGKLWDGKLGYAIGPGMALQIPHLNPFVQVAGMI